MTDLNLTIAGVQGVFVPEPEAPRVKSPVRAVVKSTLESGWTGGERWQGPSSRVRAKKQHQLSRGDQKGPEFLSGVLHHLRASGTRLDLDAMTQERLATPERILKVHFPVLMDDGNTRTFDFTRIVHSTANGPGKGGIRWAKGVGKNEVGALAAEMPLKPALYGLPLGGAKGGTDVDASTLSIGEAARLMRGSITAAMDAAWRQERRLAFGPHIDVPAPDLGTSPPGISLMDIAADEYLGWLARKGLRRADGFDVPAALGKVTRSADTATPYLDRYLELFAQSEIPNVGLIATFTGKSVAKGGSLGRTEATGLGVVYATMALLRHDGLLAQGATRFSGQTVAVQGFGNVGYGTIAAFVQLGAKVVSIAEFDGAPYAITKATGFDANDLAEMTAFKKANGTLRGYPGAEAIDPSAFWAQPVDILAPCARENQITLDNASSIAAPYVIEGANGPTTADADRLLTSRGVTVLPDIFANAAGVTVSYYEMLQNMQGERWTLEAVKDRLRTDLSRAFAALADRRAESNGTYREAAFDTAVLNILEPKPAS